MTSLECQGNYFSLCTEKKRKEERQREGKVHVIPMWRNQTLSHEFHKSWKKFHKGEKESEQEWQWDAFMSEYLYDKVLLLGLCPFQQ